MPPRLPHLISTRLSTSLYYPQQPQWPPIFLLPSLAQPKVFLSTTTHRNASILSSLRDQKGAIRHKRRVGRGPSSGKGQKSGRGHKGQKVRSGYKLPKGFEGGQTRQAIVNPEGGFKNHLAKSYTPLNLGKLASFISQARLNPTYPITICELAQSRCVANVKDGIKLLAAGHETLQSPINIVVSRASAQAIEKVESLGGKVFTRYYTPFANRMIVKGKMDPVNSLRSEFPEVVTAAAGTRSIGGDAAVGLEKGAEEVRGEEGKERKVERKRYLYRLPDPTKRKEIEYYRDPAHRGYLAHTVPAGESPSLFWKVPKVVEEGVKMQKKVKKTLAENRLF